MALSNNNLPYTTVQAVGVNPEQRVTLDFVYADDTGSLPLEDIVDTIKAAFVESPDVDTVAATHHTVTDTAI